MTDQIIEAGDLKVFMVGPEGPLMAKEGDATLFMGDAWDQKAGMVAVPLSRFAPDFFDLKTGIAGAVFQKFVNYQMRLAIIGDLSNQIAASKPLHDFVYECNQGRHIWFVDDIAALITKLEN